MSVNRTANGYELEIAAEAGRTATRTLFSEHLRDIWIDMPRGFAIQAPQPQWSWTVPTTSGSTTYGNTYVQQTPTMPFPQMPQGYPQQASQPQESINPVQAQRRLRAVSTAQGGPVSETLTGQVVNAGFTE